MSVKAKLINKKILIPLFIFLIVGISLVLVIKSLNSPAEGVVTEIISNEQIDERAKIKNIKGKYISFDFPARFERAGMNNPSASLENWLFASRQALGPGPSGQISIAVTNLPAGGAKEDSTYKLYAAFPDKYKLSTKDYNGQPRIIGTSTESNPDQIRTVFVEHKKYLLTVAISTNMQSDQLNEEMDALINSVKWLQ